ncbi:hypothetical protein AB0K93_03830 [Streptomyces sp. NPDC052676]|uniref:hypothetical protein n=1 Tax=Streptomyces sp. NPDC052676 TaxID=3154953 RepID=UPI00343EC523
MAHRITRLVAALRRLLRRRRCPRVDVHRRTVHHTGFRPPRAAEPAAVPGIGLGSLGMPAVDREEGR